MFGFLKVFSDERSSLVFPQKGSFLLTVLPNDSQPDHYECCLLNIGLFMFETVQDDTLIALTIPNEYDIICSKSLILDTFCRQERIEHILSSFVQDMIFFLFGSWYMYMYLRIDILVLIAWFYLCYFAFDRPSIISKRFRINAESVSQIRRPLMVLSNDNV